MSRNLVFILFIAAVVLTAGIVACKKHERTYVVIMKNRSVTPGWIVPDTGEITDPNEARLIKYGRSLIVHTSCYFGPKGIIAHKSNGLNCQNCHLKAGTKPNGNNYSLVAVGYPRFKERSGTVETIVKKVEDCFERSLNGSSIDSNSREMKAFVAYLKWIGKNVKKGTKPEGSGIEELAFMNRPADTAMGRVVYMTKCRTCHGNNGQGLLNTSGTGYTYPPLWGRHSYNIGASIYRLSKFAAFVKHNMPYNADSSARLTTAQAWDVAAFVNSQFHPYKNIDADWPKLSAKPYDYPFGPYADKLFSNNQRKYGPFGPIKKYYMELRKK